MSKRTSHGWAIRFWVGILIAALLAVNVPGSSQAAATTGRHEAAPSAAPVGTTPDTSRMPLYFVENRGQMSKRVAYYLTGRDENIYFTPQGLTFSFLSKDQPVQKWTTKLDFVGANPSAQPSAIDATPAVMGYFKGAKKSWQTGLKTYRTIIYRNLWPGIDALYTGTGGALKYTFAVHPGANPADIQLRYRGVAGLRINDGGALEIATPARSFTDAAPVSSQTQNGVEKTIATAYTLNQTTYGFRVGDYDRRQTLLIDPALPVYAGFLGGVGNDTGFATARDAQGNTYVTGSTASGEATFPETVGPDLSYNGGTDAFIAKVSADGATLLYAGYIGGAGFDVGSGVAVDGAGNAYLTGYTTSNQTTFPVTLGPDLTYNGANDAFVIKVNAAGSALVYAGYVGGADDDLGFGIAVDGNGGAYLAGSANSTQATFPVSVGPDLTHNGSSDAFIAKVNSGGTGLTYAGYIGGVDTDAAAGVAVDGAGNAYVAGYADSAETSFPVSVGPDVSHNGGDDAFITKVNAAGSALVYSGYVGGADNDAAQGVAVDNAGRAYLTGYTASPQASFPTLIGPDLTHNGGTDAFVASVASSGAALVYSGYIGGVNDDAGQAIALDATNHAYLTGRTASTETSFPVRSGPDLTYNGGASDAFTAKVNDAANGLAYCGYIGGTVGEEGFGIAANAAGDTSLTGVTASTAASFPVSGGPDSTHNGANDAFVMSLREVPEVAEISLGTTNSATEQTLAGGCGADAGFVRLSAPAPAGGFTVTLSDTLNAAQVPATLTIPAGRTTAIFYTTTTPVNQLETGQVTATGGGVSRSQTLNVRPVKVRSLALSTVQTTGNQTVTATATLECALPSALTLALSSSDSDVALVNSPTLTLAAGQTVGTFQVTTLPQTRLRGTIIRTTTNGAVTGAQLKVAP